MTEAQIRALADRLEPSMRRAWLQAMAQILRRVTPARIARVMAARSPRGRTAALDDIIAADVTLAPMRGLLEQGLRAAARQSLASLRVSTNLRSVSAAAARIARATAARRVVAITTAVRRVIRAEVVKATRGKQTPQQVARAIRPVIGLTPNQAAAVSRQRDALIARGVTAGDVEAIIAKVTAARIRKRAQLIAVTEANAAANSGQIAAWESLQDGGLIGGEAMKRWVVTKDDRLCPVCRPMAGQVRFIGEEFQSQQEGRILAPPLHPRCRCTVVLVAELRRAADAA